MLEMSYNSYLVNFFILQIYFNIVNNYALLWVDSAISDKKTNIDLHLFTIISKTLKDLTNFKTTSAPLFDLIIYMPVAYM